MKDFSPLDYEISPRLRELLSALRQGRWVNGFDGELGALLQRAERLCRCFNAAPVDDMALRDGVLSGLLGAIGEKHMVHSPFLCDFGFNISIGDCFTSNFGLTILDEAEVTIGNRVFIGPNVSIYTITHALLPEQRAAGVMRALPVRIEDDVWICGDVKILPGVTIGRGAVIGAGSTVVKSVPPMTLAVGAPCVPVREITENDRVEVMCDATD